MGNNFKKLFMPGYIRNLEIPNRVVMAPMGTGFAELDGSFSQRQVDYYAARARGGVGLIIVEGTRVERLIDPSFPKLPFGAADSDSLIASMADLAEAVHDYGAKIAMQLTVGFGRQGSTVRPESPPVSASAVPSFMNPNVLCRSLTAEEIGCLVEASGMAAYRAMIAGFDMVEVHAHAGYLLDQFLSSVWNKRDDEYGGDLGSRMRFALEIIQAIRDRTAPGLPIGFRLSVENGMPGGRDAEESREMARRLEAAGVDVIHADAGCYERFDLITPPIYLGDACLSDMAAAIKEAVNIPVIAVGNITPEYGEALLESGKADFIAIGRGLIADPDWANKVRTGRREDVRLCIRCNEYCIGRGFTLKPISCSVNPCAGKERYYQINKAACPKRVLVIGGGPAGMEAARIARLRGHEVTLMEKEDILGGQLLAASAPPFKKELRQLIHWWVRQLSQLDVDVRLNVEVSPQMVALMKPEVVIVATGGRPLIPELPGIEGENIIGVIDYHLGRKPVKGERIAVAGGGLAGCDAALELVQDGKQVTVVEMTNQLASDVNMVNGSSLIRLLVEHGVNILTNHKIREFCNDGLIAEGPSGEIQVTADTVILALGVQPEDRLAKALKASAAEVYVIGDCLNPAKVGEAIHSGFVAGWRV